MVVPTETNKPKEGVMEYQNKMLDLIDSVLLLLDDDEYDMAAALAHMRRLMLWELTSEDAMAQDYRRTLPLDVTFDLPVAKPVPGYVAKPPTARSVSCPRCRAKAGKPCFKLSHRGHGGVPTDTTLSGSQVHDERRRKARAS